MINAIEPHTKDSAFSKRKVMKPPKKGSLTSKQIRDAVKLVKTKQDKAGN